MLLHCLFFYFTGYVYKINLCTIRLSIGVLFYVVLVLRSVYFRIIQHKNVADENALPRYFYTNKPVLKTKYTHEN
jgi:hypothetical protein